MNTDIIVLSLSGSVHEVRVLDMHMTHDTSVDISPHTHGSDDTRVAGQSDVYMALTNTLRRYSFLPGELTMLKLLCIIVTGTHFFLLVTLYTYSNI